MKINLKIISIIFSVLVIGAAAYFIFGIRLGTKTGVSVLKCPDEYKNSDERIAAFDEFTKDFYDKNPNASIGDLADARNNFYKEHNCTEALKRYNDYMTGNISAETVKNIEGVVADTFPTPTGSEEPQMTAEEAYSDPYILHVRKALNSYLAGRTDGIGESVIEGLDSGSNLNCGLAKFDKAYYKSKFIIWDMDKNKYGGKYADIVFIDKPDKIFWAWVYKYHSEGEPLILRGFCENGPPDNLKKELPSIIRDMVKELKYSL